MPEHIRAFLVALGVATQPHSGRTFIEHLDGTYRLLQPHGETIALAGALHSIYGTQYYKPRATPTREQVRALVGAEVEQLAYLFCTLDRKTLKALSLIYIANAQEQRGNG